MKYVVILADGMADYPIEALGGKTPMEKAKKPTMDRLASEGKQFLVKTVPDSLKPGSDVANLSVMGYDPLQYYTGRSPLEAASIGIDLLPTDTALRVNLVTLSDEPEFKDKTMLDYSAGEISTEESSVLLKAIDEQLRTDNYYFQSGVSYRHIMVWKNAPENLTLTPPHDISDRKIAEYLPNDPTLLAIMEASTKVLKNHPINQKRIAQGKNPATSLWPWGEGKKPSMPTFKEKFGIEHGSVISAVDLIKGLGKCMELDVIDVEGATGNVDTNWDGKANAAINALKNGSSFLYVHMEAPDESGHQGSVENKVFSIEAIDEKVLTPIVAYLDSTGENYRVLVLPDHPTPICTKTHAGDPVPCLFYEKETAQEKAIQVFSEKNAALSQNVFAPGDLLMQWFLHS